MAEPQDPNFIGSTALQRADSTERLRQQQHGGVDDTEEVGAPEKESAPVISVTFSHQAVAAPSFSPRQQQSQPPASQQQQQQSLNLPITDSMASRPPSSLGNVPSSQALPNTPDSKQTSTIAVPAPRLDRPHSLEEDKVSQQIAGQPQQSIHTNGEYIDAPAQQQRQTPPPPYSVAASPTPDGGNTAASSQTSPVDREYQQMMQEQVMLRERTHSLKQAVDSLLRAIDERLQGGVRSHGAIADLDAQLIEKRAELQYTTTLLERNDKKLAEHSKQQKAIADYFQNLKSKYGDGAVAGQASARQAAAQSPDRSVRGTPSGVTVIVDQSSPPPYTAANSSTQALLPVSTTPVEPAVELINLNPNAAQGDQPLAGQSPEGQATEGEMTDRVKGKEHRKGESTVLSPRQLVSGTVSVELAERYRYLTLPHKKTESGYELYPVCGFSQDDFGQFGAGIYLYFVFLKRIGMLMLVCALCALPNIVANISGNTIYSKAYFWVELTTMANIGTAVNTTHVDILGTSMDKKDIGLMFTFTDAIYSLLFLYIVYRLIKMFRKEAAETEEKETTVADYTVKVVGLPPDCTDRLQVASFFARWGKIVDVTIAYNDGTLLEMYSNRGALQQRLAVAKVRNKQSQVRDLRNDIKELDADIKEFLKSFEKRTVCAFVTFHRHEDQEQCIQAYKHSYLYWLCCLNKDLWFKGRRLRVERAPEPSNVLYANLIYTQWGRRLRKVLTFTATVLIMCVTAFFVFLTRYYQNKIPQDAECPLYAVSRDQAVENPLLAGCYCRQLGRHMFDDSEICVGWIKNYILSKVLLAISSIIIVSVNYTLKLFISWFAHLERHTTLTAQESAITVKLFLGQFCNTAIVVLMVNARFGEDDSSFMPGEFTDFTQDWFLVVGTSIILTLGLGIFFPHLLDAMMVRISECWRNCRRSNMQSQLELNELYSGPTFLLAERYAIHLNTVFCCLFYSGGMPLLLWFAACTMFLCYWCEKYALLRYYRIPARFDQSLSELTMSILPYAVVVHLLLSGWFYSAPDIMQSYSMDVSSIKPLHEAQGQLANESVNDINFAARVFQWNSFPMFLLAFLFVAFKILYMVLSFFHISCGSQVEASIPMPDYFAAKEKLRHTGQKFASYRVCKQEQYQVGFVKTPSRRQLKPENDLGYNDGWRGKEPPTTVDPKGLPSFIAAKPPHKERRESMSVNATSKGLTSSLTSSSTNQNQVRVSVQSGVASATSSPSKDRTGADRENNYKASSPSTASVSSSPASSPPLPAHRHILSTDGLVTQGLVPRHPEQTQKQLIKIPSMEPPSAFHTPADSRDGLIAFDSDDQKAASDAGQLLDSVLEEVPEEEGTVQAPRRLAKQASLPGHAAEAQYPAQYPVQVIMTRCTHCMQPIKILDRGVPSAYGCPFCGKEFEA